MYYHNALMFALHVCFLSCVYLLLVCYVHDFPFMLISSTYECTCTCCSSFIQGSGKLIVNAKGSDSQLVSNLLDEVKALV